MAWSLCSKEDILDFHPLQESELRDSWSNVVKGLIRRHLGAPYLGTLETITDEYHSGDGTAILRVRKGPIHSVTSVRVSGLAYPEQTDGVSLSPDDYVVFETYIQLKSGAFPKGNLNVVIAYESGSREIEEDVRLAAIAMIIAIVNYRKRQGADSSFKWGADRDGDKKDRQIGQDSPSLNVGLTSHLIGIMKRILRRKDLRVH